MRFVFKCPVPLFILILNKVNLILADSNDLIRLGLRTVLTAELNVAIVGEARNEKELMAQLAAFGASIVLIDFTSE